MTGFVANRSDHVTLRNSKIHNIGRACVHFLNSDFGIIDRNRIYNCGTEGPNGEGVYLGARESKEVVTRGHAIRNNELYNTRDEAVDLKYHSHDILVDNNNIYNIQLRNGGAINVRGSGHVVRNNRIRNVRRGSRLMPGINTETRSVTLYNNTMQQTMGCKGIGC
jgi:hypothetical protein